MVADAAAQGLAAEPGITPAVSSQAELIRRAAGGDKAAFGELYRQHADRVYGLCLRMTGSPDIAEDCVQETFVKAWSRLGSFRGASALGTWLHRIAVNEVLSWQRREARRREVPATDAADMDPQGLLASYPMAEDQLALERAILSLPEGARNVFVLAGIYGHSHQEAADMLGVAPGTCKAQLHRARRLLAEHLEL